MRHPHCEQNFQRTFGKFEDFSDEDLDKDATVEVDGEFFGVCHFGVSCYLDETPLDEGHPYLSVNTNSFIDEPKNPETLSWFLNYLLQGSFSSEDGLVPHTVSRSERIAKLTEDVPLEG